MSAAAATAPDAAAPAKPKSRKLLYILLGLVVFGLLAAGGALYVLKKNTAEDDHDDDDEVTTSAPARPATPPAFLALENMVVNLADPGGNRFVQIGISLQIQDDKTGKEMQAYMPSIRSSVLLLISQRTSEELLQLAGKEKLANDIVADISRIMGYRLPEAAAANGERPKRASKLPPNPVQAVLFSSFIVQ
ncbi:flagellar basal body-associated protein FliL [Hydrogenophaga sp.]|uniref:flagellar basal body-associated FliL family protein n=1 Tax=Hydrogenophaga sp. TaxID=1904254 RepID=UPI002716016E|nr:flagellar basal body-associated FliL family protein [Hydrogenophaga sp.]MDO8905523.1 flagellar basal body-associated FliL family protein [Hydrogenophaga sp.]